MEECVQCCPHICPDNSFVFVSLSHSLSKETHILTKLVEGVRLSIDDNHLVVSRWPLRVGNGLQLAPLV